MPLSIMVVALLLLASGLGGVVLGVSLTPTDMGRLWLDVGATALTGGMLTLALGYATRAVVAALERLLPDPAELPVPRETSVLTAPGQKLSPQDPSSEEEAMPHLATTTSALAPAWAGALGALGEKDGTGHEGYERDIFAPRKRVTAPPEADETSVALIRPENTPDNRVEPVMNRAVEGLGLRLGERRVPLGEGQGDEPAPSAAISHPAPAQPSATKAIPDGVIADEDLTALVEREPALAPLDELEIVGAYDSGGVRFTMYSDGSVHARAPHGEQRYPSLEALRQQLDSGQPVV